MTPLALLLALLSQGEVWTSFPLPGLCLEPAAQPRLEPHLWGEHLLLGAPSVAGRGAEAARAVPAALPASLLVSLLQEDARRSGSGLTLFPVSSTLLARGPQPALAALGARLAALDGAGARLAVEVEAWLVPGGAAALAEPAVGATSESGAPPGADRARAAGLAWRARGRSGEGLGLGERTSHPFLAGYRIEVASDSGVASPIVGRASLGKSLHVVATRALGGTRVHLEGFLDLAELAGLEAFDPGTPDLGLVEQPVVRSVQVAFSGSVASGGLLRVDLAGTALETPDWTLWVRASTQADAPAGEGAGWRLVDLALLARAPLALPGLAPGAALDPLPSAALLPRVLEPLAPAALAAGLAPDPRRTSFPTFTDRIALLDAGAQAEHSALLEVSGALERVRLQARTVELEHGSLRVSLPLSHGSHARLRAGVERTLLVDYDAQIAPDTWMPVPVVERCFDGLVWQGVLDGERVECAYWSSATDSLRTRGVEDARLGALQLPVRSLRAGAGSYAAAEGRRGLIDPGPGGRPGLSMGIR